MCTRQQRCSLPPGTGTAALVSPRRAPMISLERCTGVGTVLLALSMLVVGFLGGCTSMIARSQVDVLSRGTVFAAHWAARVPALAGSRARQLECSSSCSTQTVVSQTPWTCVISGRTMPNTSCNVNKVVPASDDDTPPNWRPRALGGESHGYAWRLEPFACCAWSDAYRFIYIKHAKVGGSTVLPGFLRPSICPVEPQGPSDPHQQEQLPFPENCTGAILEPLHSDCAPCHVIPRWKWLHYYVFSIVRHPLARAISSYSYCEKSKTVSFAEWCMNLDAGAGICGGSTDPGRPNMHWAPQAPVMCKDGRCMVDFIARSERLDSDMDVIVDSINAVRNASYPPLRHFSVSRIAMNSQLAAMPGNTTSIGQGPPPVHAAGITTHELTVRSFQRARSTFTQYPHCYGALASWYAADLQILGYDPLDVAPLS